MPNFDSSSWSSFKQQLLSVLDWLVYSFNLLFDSFRSHPMLYVFLFFPIFALVIFIILDFLFNVVHIQSIFEGSDIHTDNALFKVSSFHDNRKSGQAVNLAAVQSQKSRGVNGNSLGSVTGSSIGSVSGSSSLGKSISFGTPGSVKGNGDPTMSGRFSGNDTHALSVLLGNTVKQLFKTGKAASKLAKDSKARQQQDEDMYNQIAAEQEALQAKHQADIDKAFNMRTDLWTSKDENGDITTIKVTSNSRTDEDTGYHVTVKHNIDKQS